MENCIIRTAADLEDACAASKETGIMAIDTEFVWRRTYRPKLGIVQIGADDRRCHAIDCMTCMSVDPLKAVLEDETIVKILHDATQDTVLLHHYAGSRPRNIFDTQVAAAFAGFPAMMGLQRLLMEAIDVGLPKTQTCTDWTQRPLTEAQVLYALDDVRYLPALRQELLARAEALGTRAWLEEEMLGYDDGILCAEPEPDEFWKKIKVRRATLDRRGFAVLRAVTELRENTACKWNLPRNWLGDDESLVEMASRGAVGHIRHRLRGGQVDTLKALYAGCVKRALELPEEEWPEAPDMVTYIPEVREAAEKAIEWLATKAQEIHVAPAIIANRATVMAFVDNVDDNTNPLAWGWRYEAVGREMAEKFGVD